MLSSGRLRRICRRLAQSRTQPTDTLAAKYERRTPSAQNALDLVPGWTSSFPEEFNLSAGTLALHADPRLHWALDCYGSLEGARVLELGPLEGGHTYIFEQRGAAEILAIEANKQAYLRCLITKEIYGMTKSKFMLGDFERYLEETTENFDLILASGVLYHMHNPVQVLDRIGKTSKSLILWTHYFDEAILHKNDPRRSVFSQKPLSLSYNNRTYKLHQRTYKNSWDADSYCGGPDDTHYWMERDDIVSLCKENGFDDIRVSFENNDGANGPSCLFFMRKSNA